MRNQVKQVQDTGLVRSYGMNNKAQTLGITIMTAIFLFIVGMMCINFIMPEVSTARIDLNCASADIISDGTKLMCLALDTTVIYWIWGILSIVIGGITSKLLI